MFLCTMQPDTCRKNIVSGNLKATLNVSQCSQLDSVGFRSCVENLWDWFNMQVLTVWCLSLPGPETGVFRALGGQSFKNADSKVKNGKMAT